MSEHTQASSADCMGWLWQHLCALKHYTDVLAFRVLEGVFVVFDVAWLSGVDGVVAAHCAVVAGEPFGAALAEDDVAWDYVLFCCFSLLSVSDLFFLPVVSCLGLCMLVVELV